MGWLEMQSVPNQPPKDSNTPLLAILVFLLFVIILQLVIIFVGRYRDSKMRSLQEVLLEESKIDTFSDKRDLEKGDTVPYMTLEEPEPLTMECRKLCLEINEVAILNEVTLRFTPGTMTAIMGPSGTSAFEWDFGNYLTCWKVGARVHLCLFWLEENLDSLVKFDLESARSMTSNQAHSDNRLCC
jgi:hypothetical protein